MPKQAAALKPTEIFANSPAVIEDTVLTIFNQCGGDCVSFFGGYIKTPEGLVPLFSVYVYGKDYKLKTIYTIDPNVVCVDYSHAGCSKYLTTKSGKFSVSKGAKITPEKKEGIEAEL